MTQRNPGQTWIEKRGYDAGVYSPTPNVVDNPTNSCGTCAGSADLNGDPTCRECGRSFSPMARCGRTAPHGGHWAHEIGRPCAGNVNIVTAREAAPCFCDGPWWNVNPADRPETRLGHEHASGVDGCTYVRAY